MRRRRSRLRLESTVPEPPSRMFAPASWIFSRWSWELTQLNVAEASWNSLAPGFVSERRIEPRRSIPPRPRLLMLALPSQVSAERRSPRVAPCVSKDTAPEAESAVKVERLGEAAKSADKSAREKVTSARYAGIAASSASSEQLTAPPKNWPLAFARLMWRP